MSPADLAWLRMDRPTNLMVNNVVLWFDAPVDWERFKAICRERLVGRFPRFGQRVAESRVPWRRVGWEDDPRFDLEHHLHRLALPAPGDRAALLELVGDLMATPLDHDKPLWDMYLVEGYGAGGAIVSRTHHSIADGIAIERVMLSLTDDARDGAFAPAPIERRHRRRPTHAVRVAIAAIASRMRHAAEAVGRGCLRVAAHPRQLGAQTRAVKQRARALTDLRLAGSEVGAALKGELGVVQRVATSRPVSLADVKRTGHATGTTVNDVMLTAVTGALGSYLRERGGPVAEIHAFVPFNVRPLGEPIPRDLGNKFGPVLLTLPAGLHDPQQRLAEVHRRMAELKDTAQGARAYALIQVIGMVPPDIGRVIIDATTAKASALITNVIGPPYPVSVAGTAVRGMLVWAPRPGSVPMSVTIFSYNGEITVGLGTDAGLIPGPELILSGVEDELAELQRLASRSKHHPGAAAA
ncbi:MAG TPA: wax ester/triacylglycerol synthase family O-acyltransferase [Baekduia sp.]|uniref:wax ester/triacylglycerol synthase family O-acyltransferase n=1 Tax=Baekduia sp. TaxID=2600305 RepID=UPI002C82E148|nr:wax ester/triacylglycerol synthase family O-acyltransferase [Baekduia sp.]HMJ34525.1 wax ester/triacylglycerol synthase family O-acyltransferase [Baekduia sp.]